MSPEAKQILDHINSAFEGILDLGLNRNHIELVTTIHHLQMFVMMYELQGDWNDWYDKGASD